MAENVYVSEKSVVEALRALTTQKFKRAGRTALMGFLMLKAKEPKPGAKFRLSSIGDQSVEPELKRFFRVAPGTAFPDVNPFGQSQGAIEYLADGYERRGTFTHLYPGRNLEPILNVTPGDGFFEIEIPDTAAAEIAKRLDTKIPRNAAAAFLLRNESFDKGSSKKELVDRLQSELKLTNKDMALLFKDDDDFDLQFDSKKYQNSLVSLPSDLLPRTTNVSHATASRASKRLVAAAVGLDVDLAIDPAIRRRIQRAVARSKAVALVGPPGSAKSSLWEEILKEAAADPGAIGLKNPPNYVCYTAEIDWTARTLIGGYYPQANGQLVFKEGYFLRAIRENQIFWLEEMNRADLDRVLGPILTFLAGQDVDLGPTHLGDEADHNVAKQMTLMWVKGEKSEVIEDEEQRIYCVGTDWRMIGTYNNVDRGRVFPMGSALLRRWAIVPVTPASPDTFVALLKELEVREPVAELLKAAYELHLQFLPIGPASFLDMGRYVTDVAVKSTDAGVSVEEREALHDAYVLYMGQQLMRLDPDKREEFFKALGGIFGPDLAAEATSF
jgi:MoxR-like ATPase